MTSSSSSEISCPPTPTYCITCPTLYPGYEIEKVYTELSAPRKLIVIVNDLEFSGPREFENFVVSWGSSAFDAVTKELLGTHCVKYKRPPGKFWDLICVKEFWLKKPELKAEYERVERGEGLNVEQGTPLKVDWIHKMVDRYVEHDPKRLLPFFSDTAGPDNMWMNSYLGKIRHDPMHLFFGFFRDTFVTSCFSLGLVRRELGDLFSDEKDDCGLVSKGRFSEDQIVRTHFQIDKLRQPTTVNNHDPVEDTRNIYEEYLIHVDEARSDKFNLKEFVERTILEYVGKL